MGLNRDGECEETCIACFGALRCAIAMMLQPASPSTASLLRSRVGRVCVALQGKTLPELLERAEAALPESRFLEFRLDSLEKPAAAVQPVARFLEKARARLGEVAAIATCRRRAFGGGFRGTLAEELSILTQAARAGFSMVDVEIESAEEASKTEWEKLREAGASVLISFHDFSRTGDLDGVLARMRRYSPDFAKVVTTAESLSDSLTVLRWLESRSDEARLVGLAMGEQGLVSRILGLRAGSVFTFAAAPDGEATAPGQVTAHAQREMYRVEELDQATRIYGVAGNPVAHSLSPLMQNAAFRRERFNAVYLPLKVERMDDLLRVITELPLSGLSVTMPFKQEILPYLANLDPLSARLGACNTVRLGADKRLYGFNTDVAGVVRPLERRMALKGAKVLVLGAGGAARAAVYGLADKGSQVFVWSRNEALGAELASAAGAQSMARAEIGDIRFDALVNATPCGMVGNPEPLPLQAEEWDAGIVFDLVYNPLETPLLKMARRRGAVAIQGVEMFVQQGARQFELWTGKPAPEADMLRTVLFALHKSQTADSK